MALNMNEEIDKHTTSIDKLGLTVESTYAQVEYQKREVEKLL